MQQCFWARGRLRWPVRKHNLVALLANPGPAPPVPKHPFAAEKRNLGHHVPIHAPDVEMSATLVVRYGAMDLADQYRLKAEEAARKAASKPSEVERLAFEKVAEEWRQLERRARLRAH